MADLIIKPATGDGNKLILQDKAGGAVLTTADSGATIANATLTSPTLNSPTLVTPALGTPASGVLTNATFPAGHTLQIQSTRLLTQVEASFSSATTVMTQAITPTATSSKILVMVKMHGCVVRDGSTTGKLWIERDAAAICRIEDYMKSADQDPTQYGMDFLDSPSSTSSLTYTVRMIRVSGSANIAINHYTGGSTENAALYGSSSLILMEIAG